MLPAIYSIVAPSPVEAQSVPPPPRSDADERLAESRHPGRHVGGHADRHQFRRRRHGGGRRRWRRDGRQRRSGQHDVADRQLRARSDRSLWCPHRDGHDGRRDEAAGKPSRSMCRPGSATFNFTGSPEIFTVPAGVVSITIQATGAQGGRGAGIARAESARGVQGGRTTATVSVAPGALLTVRVGGAGPNGSAGICDPRRLQRRRRQ